MSTRKPSKIKSSNTSTFISREEKKREFRGHPLVRKPFVFESKQKGGVTRKKSLCKGKSISKPNKCKKINSCKVAKGTKRAFCRKKHNKPISQRKKKNGKKTIKRRKRLTEAELLRKYNVRR